MNMTVFTSFLDQFIDDFQWPSIPQIHSPAKPTEGQFIPQQQKNIKNDDHNVENGQIPGFYEGIHPLDLPSNSNASLNSLFSSSTSSSDHFYDPSDNFSDLFPSLPDQEEDWHEFGWLLDCAEQQSVSIAAGSTTTKAMWLDENEGPTGKKMEVDEQPVAMRTRSHLPKTEQQILRKKGAEEAIAFWQQEQIQQWIEAVDVEMKKKLSKKRARIVAMKTKKMMNGRRDSRRRKSSKDQNNAKNGSNVCENLGQMSMNLMEEENAQRQNGGGEMVEEKANTVYCICQRPDDQFSFYVGCDGCNGWFHAECVGTTQEKISAMDGPFFCPNCCKFGKGRE